MEQTLGNIEKGAVTELEKRVNDIKDIFRKLKDLLKGTILHDLLHLEFEPKSMTLSMYLKNKTDGGRQCFHFKGGKITSSDNLSEIHAKTLNTWLKELEFSIHPSPFGKQHGAITGLGYIEFR